MSFAEELGKLDDLAFVTAYHELRHVQKEQSSGGTGDSAEATWLRESYPVLYMLAAAVMSEEIKKVDPTNSEAIQAVMNVAANMGGAIGRYANNEKLPRL